MATNIVRNSGLPRAIAKEKNGIVLYWIEELGIAGLNAKGLARLLQYDHGSLGKFLKGVEQKPLLRAEIVTGGGLQGVDLYDGETLSEILVEIISSSINKETRLRAKKELKRLASAGFSLMVMMELAPAELAARAVSHNDEIELERLKNENIKLRSQFASQVNTLVVLHGEALGLTIAGINTAEIIETKVPVTEVLNPVTGACVEFLDAKQLAGEVSRRSGQKIKNADFIRKLKAANRDDLVVPVTRNTTCEYVKADDLDEAISIVFGKSKQTLLAPSISAIASCQ